MSWSFNAKQAGGSRDALDAAKETGSYGDQEPGRSAAIEAAALILADLPSDTTYAVNGYGHLRIAGGSIATTATLSIGEVVEVQ